MIPRRVFWPVFIAEVVAFVVGLVGMILTIGGMR
jgi:hypothetical protein